MWFAYVLHNPSRSGVPHSASVHIVHRYLKLGSVSEVFTKIGHAILYTSLTTMAAFGSLLLGKYKGYPTFGAVVLIGVGMAFVVTVTLLPPF